LSDEGGFGGKIMIFLLLLAGFFVLGIYFSGGGKDANSGANQPGFGSRTPLPPLSTMSPAVRPGSLDGPSPVPGALTQGPSAPVLTVLVLVQTAVAPGSTPLAGNGPAGDGPAPAGNPLAPAETSLAAAQTAAAALETLAASQARRTDQAFQAAQQRTAQVFQAEQVRTRQAAELEQFRTAQALGGQQTAVAIQQTRTAAAVYWGAQVANLQATQQAQAAENRVKNSAAAATVTAVAAATRREQFDRASQHVLTALELALYLSMAITLVVGALALRSWLRTRERILEAMALTRLYVERRRLTELYMVMRARRWVRK
jgi:hypothetical protein